jgi:hypothetical protein
MALKNTILGLLGRTPDKSDELEDAEIDAADREYAEHKAEAMLEERFGTRPGEFDEQDGPRR